MDHERNTVPLYNEAGKHIGYYHKPTGQVATRAGNWSVPKLTTSTFTMGNKAHAERLRAAEAAGLITREIPTTEAAA